MITVNDITIAQEDILREMQYHPAPTQEAAMDKAARHLIVNALLSRRATELGLLVPGDSLDDCMDDLLAHEVDTPTAGEHECRLYYQNNRHRFTTSPLVAARHILLPAAPGDDQQRAQALRLAESLIQVLQAEPGRFAELAAAHSRCDSAKAGGDLGQLGKGQTVAEFERHVFRANPGLIPHPVETRYGVHVVRVDHHEPGRPLPFEFVYERIETYLNEKVRRKAIAHYVQHLISEADIRGYDFGVTGSPLMQ
ncbi:MAG: peptidylprolyl isomerase [Burkholderiaceae bacterium]|jgi:peptidyl-prolyl cis-trans isomerase C